MEITITIDRNTSKADLREILRKIGMAYSEGRQGRADSFADIAQKVGNEHGILFGPEKWIERNQDGFSNDYRGHEAVIPILEAKVSALWERRIKKHLERQEKEGPKALAA